MNSKIKNKEEYFRELKTKLSSDFYFLFENNLFFDSYITSRLYTQKEFESFKKQLPLNIEEKKLRYIFEHSRKYGETFNLSIENYFERLIKCEIKRTGKLDIIIHFFLGLKDQISLYGFIHKFSDDNFINEISKFTPAEFEIVFNKENFPENSKVIIDNINKNLKKYDTIRDKVKSLITEFIDVAFINDSDAYYINVFNNDFFGNSLYIDTSNAINHSFSFKQNNYNDGVMAIDKKIIDFWNSLGNDRYFDPINKYLEDAMKKYDALIASLEPGSIECKTIKSVMYWLVYLGLGNRQMKYHMDAIKNADVSWATKTEETKNPSFYGNSKFAKAFSSWYSFLEAKENPNTNFINNAEHNKMDRHAISLHRLFGEVGLDFAEIDKIIDTLNIARDFADIIKILDERVIVNVNVGDYINGFVSSIINAIAQMLDFGLALSYQQLFYLKIIPFNGKKISLSDIYNYLNFLKLIIENSDGVGDFSNLNTDILLDGSLEAVGVNISQFREIGYGAYEQKLNSSSGIVFFAKDFYPSRKNSKAYFTLAYDLPVLYTLIEFAIEKRVVHGDSYAKRNAIFGSKDEVNALLYQLTEEEIAFIFDKLNVDIFNTKKYIHIDKKYSDKNNDYINTSELMKLLEGTYLYQEYSKKDFFEMKELARNESFQNNYYKFIDFMLKEYFEVLDYNRQKIVKNVYYDQDLGDFDDFLARFLPSILQFASLFGKEVETKEALLQIVEKAMSIITDLLFEKVLNRLRDEIQYVLRNAQETLFKKLRDTEEKLSFLNQKVEFDLDLSSKPFIDSLLTTLDFLEKFALKIPRSIIPCFESGNYDIADSFRIDDSYRGNNPSDFIDNQNKFDPQVEDEDKKENVIYNEEKPWEIIYHNKLGEKIKYKNITAPGKSSIIKKDSGSITTIEKTIVTITEKPEKIVYEKGEVKLIYKDGTEEVIIDKYSQLNYPKKTSDASYIKREITNEIISKNLSKDDLERMKEIKNFIEQIGNLEYYAIVKKINAEKNKIELEHQKNIPNYNEIRKSQEIVENLTKQLKDIKSDFILNTNINESITLLEFNENNTIKLNLDKYRDLNEFFTKKIDFMKEIDNILSDEKNKDTYLSTYQITQLLR